MARLTAFLLFVVLLTPASALALQDPFGPIPQAPPEQTAPPEDDTLGTEEDDGLSRSQEILIGLSGGLLITGIAFAIWRDAKKSAPVEHHLRADEGGTQSKGSRKPKQQRVQQGRQKSKAARRA